MQDPGEHFSSGCPVGVRVRQRCSGRGFTSLAGVRSRLLRLSTLPLQQLPVRPHERYVLFGQERELVRWSDLRGELVCRTCRSGLVRATYGRRVGRQRQMRRRWPSWTPRWLAFSLWGITLGIGLLTAIPYTSWLLVMLAELLSGPTAGAAAGALLDASRESLVFIAAIGTKEPTASSTYSTRASIMSPGQST